LAPLLVFALGQVRFSLDLPALYSRQAVACRILNIELGHGMVMEQGQRVYREGCALKSTNTRIIKRQEAESNGR